MWPNNVINFYCLPFSAYTDTLINKENVSSCLLLFLASEQYNGVFNWLYSTLATTKINHTVKFQIIKTNIYFAKVLTISGSWYSPKAAVFSAQDHRSG